MADTDTPYPYERQVAHDVMERVNRFLQRVDQDREARTKETEGRPSITQGIRR